MSKVEIKTVKVDLDTRDLFLIRCVLREYANRNIGLPAIAVLASDIVKRLEAAEGIGISSVTGASSVEELPTTEIGRWIYYPDGTPMRCLDCGAPATANANGVDSNVRMGGDRYPACDACAEKSRVAAWGKQ